MKRRDMIKMGAASVAGMAIPMHIAAQQNTNGELPAGLPSAPARKKPKRGTMTGKKALLEQLVMDGVTHIFGNPGSAEHGLLMELNSYPELKYILGLHEGVCVSMADGFARMSRIPAIVQLHITPGLGNAIGLMKNAMDTQTPIVILAGMNEQRSIYQEPQLWGPLIEMARPVTKWAYELRTAQEVPQVLRRAMKIASEPPFGPVFLSLPIDVLDDEAEMEITTTTYTSWQYPPAEDAISQAASMLLEAKNPMIMVGDAITLSNANEEVITLAKMTGAALFENGNQCYINVPFSHPQFMGSDAFLFQGSMKERLTDCDCLLAIGGQQFMFTYPKPGEKVIPQDCGFIQINPVSWELGKNEVPDIAILADPKAAVARLNELIDQNTSTSYEAERTERIKTLKARSDKSAKDYQQSIQKGWNNSPISGARLMAELKEVLPDNATVFSQSLSNAGYVSKTIPSENPLQLLRAGGSALGLGIPTPMGMALAAKDRKVVGICSDGSAMYSIQALWTALHHNIPVTFIMLNNGAYHVLKLAVKQYYDLTDDEAKKLPGTDLNPPPIDFESLAASIGLPAWRVKNPSNLRSVLNKALNTDGPSLVDVIMEAPMGEFGT